MSKQEGTIYIVDDDEAVRAGLAELMRSVSLPVRTFASAQEFLEAYTPSWRGCLLLDIRMPGMSGLTLHERLAGRTGVLPVIFVTAHGDVSMAVDVMKLGAFDFIEKPVRGQALLDKVNRALALSQEAHEQGTQRREVQAKLDRLTDREREVLECVIADQKPKAIALKLGLSRKTVDVHIGRIREKLGVESETQLVRLLYESGVLQSIGTDSL